MSVDLKDSLIFDALSVMPSQTYKIKYVNYEPMEIPVNGAFTSGQKVTIPLGGNPNYFIMDAKLQFETLGLYSYADATDSNNVINIERVSHSLPAYRPGLSVIEAPHETLNSGGLTIYDQSNEQESNVFACLRAALSRGFSYGRGISNSGLVQGNDIVDTTLFQPDYIGLDGLGSTNFVPRPLRTKGFYRVTNPNTVNGETTPLLKGFKYWSVPMTSVSSLFQSMNVIPIGFFSTWSANPYRFSFRVAPASRAFHSYVVKGAAAGNLDAAVSLNQVYLYRPRIVCKILEVLDDRTMEVYRALFNKTIRENVGGTESVPLSLQLNTLQYSYHSSTLTRLASRYHVRIPCDWASLRGIAFRIVRQDTIQAMTYNTDPGFPLSNDADYNNNAIPTEFQIKINGECIMESAEKDYSVTVPTRGVDTTQLTATTLDNWFNLQRQKAGHLFSLRGHWMEARKEGVEGVEDRWINQGNTGNASGLVKAYCVSLENIINHEKTAVDACGIDLRSIGGVDLHMTIKAPSNGNNESGALDNLQFDYTLYAILVGDAIYEISRSGAKEISQQVL